jgi:NADH:ubiquinone oxidoreductase subunit 6 (subunit J)
LLEKFALSLLIEVCACGNVNTSVRSKYMEWCNQFKIFASSTSGTMTLSFVVIAVLTIAGAVAAVSLRNVVHCALSLTLAFVGLAALYLHLGAQFAGLAQILVYSGGVAILLVFAILLTRGTEPSLPATSYSAAISGAVVATLVFSVLAWAIIHGSAAHRTLPEQPQVGIKQIGDILMSQFVLPLEVLGLLLTVALIGAVILAMHEKRAVK